MRSANFFKTNRARELRRNSTRAELRLWQKLRSRGVDGHKFVRQEPIGPYVADFVCRKARLIIELDGGQHADSTRDAIRDRWLVDRGYRILRFWNNDVFTNIEGVWLTIAAALGSVDANAQPCSVTSRRLRGEVDLERSEKSGEGASPSAQTRGEAPSPGASRRPLPASGER
ncbi:MAG: endonuclease domain-containing protein [Xanthobacteraceae bacterium]|nr:endonuclease domain-containing protein [Xanthobacteraceae bacterium]